MISSSAARSAAVTGDRSGLVSTTTPRRRWASAAAPAAATASRATFTARCRSIGGVEDMAIVALDQPRWLNMEEPPRFELGNGGFADHCLTTWLWLLTAHAMYQTSGGRSTCAGLRPVTPSSRQDPRCGVIRRRGVMQGALAR